MTGGEISGIVIGVLVAIATPFVSVYLANRKKLKVKFSHSANFINMPYIPNNITFAIINVANTGRRVVKIDTCYIWIAKNKKIPVFAQQNILLLYNNTPIQQIPAMNSEDNISICIPLAYINNALVPNQAEYRNKLKIEIVDSTGKSHFCKYKISLQAIYNHSL